MDRWAAISAQEHEPERPRAITPVGEQVKRLMPALVAVYTLGLAALGLLVVASRRSDRPMAYFTRDPAAELGGEVYVGVLSNVGILLWTATATVCLFVAFTGSRELPTRRFLAWSGALTTGLLVDDLFLLHEDVIPNELGVHQGVVLIGYVCAFGFYSLKFVRHIAASDYLPLLVAIGFFALSLAIDVMLEKDFTLDVLGPGFKARHLFEDGTKFLGILGWAMYFMRESARATPRLPAAAGRS